MPPSWRKFLSVPRRSRRARTTPLFALAASFSEANVFGAEAAYRIAAGLRTLIVDAVFRRRQNLRGANERCAIPTISDSHSLLSAIALQGHANREAGSVRENRPREDDHGCS